MKKILSLFLALAITTAISVSMPLATLAAANDNNVTVTDFTDNIGGFDHGASVNDPADSSNKVFSNNNSTSATSPYSSGVFKNCKTFTGYGYINFEFYISSFDQTLTFLVKFKGSDKKSYSSNIFTINKTNKQLRLWDKTATVDGAEKGAYAYVGPVLEKNKWYSVNCYYDTVSKTLNIRYGERGSAKKTTVVMKNFITISDGVTCTATDVVQIQNAFSGFYLDNIETGFIPSFKSYVLDASISPIDLEARLDEYAAYGAYTYPTEFTSMKDEYQSFVISDVYTQIKAENSAIIDVDTLNAALKESAGKYNPYTKIIENDFSTATTGFTGDSGNTNELSVENDILKADGGTDANNSYYTSVGDKTSGTAIITFDYKTPEKILKTTEPEFAGFSTYIMSLRDKNNTSYNLSISRFGSGLESEPWVNTSGSYKVKTSTWYNFMIVIDYPSKTYSAYVKERDTEEDYTLALTQALSANGTYINNMYVYGPKADTVYYDNLYVGKYDFAAEEDTYTAEAETTAQSFMSTVTCANYLTASLVDEEGSAVENTATMRDGYSVKLADKVNPGEITKLIPVKTTGFKVYDVTVNGGNTFTLGTTNTVSFRLANSTSSPYAAIAAQYAGGILQAVKVVSGTVLENQTSIDAELTTKNVENSEIRVYLWESLSNLKPYANFVSETFSAQ